MSTLQLAPPKAPAAKAAEPAVIPQTAETAASPAAPQKNHRKRILATLLAIAATAGATKLGYDWYTVGRFIEKTDDAYVGGNITVIAPKVSSFIEEVAVEDNQMVHAGDLLLRLDDRDFRAALAKAEAGISEQQAALIELAASRKLQEAVVAQEEAAISVTDADIDLTKNQEERSRKLLESSAASRHDFEKADADYKSATAEGIKAHATLEAAKLQLGVIDSKEAQIKASLQKATADRDMAQLNLSYTELRAPVDGVVGNRSAQNGAFAPAGTQLISLVPTTGLWIDANFKESQIAQMRPGMAVEIEADSHSGKVFHGHVESLSPATGARFSVLPPENATGNFTKIVQRVPVRVALDEAGSSFGDLRPGLSVTARINVHNSK
ncbi:MAG: hemolysin [Akkermansiaceae bacterium]|nr:hemolysin [Akkermansiaceae bacterium]